MNEILIKNYDSNVKIESILELENELNHPLKKDDLLYEINENPVSNFFFAYIDNKIIGYIDYWITFDNSTIFKIVVKKDYRRMGIGSSLLNKVIEKLKEKEVLYLTLEVRVSNLEAIKLYEKFNFKKISIKKGYYDNFEDAIYMVRGLYE